MLTGRKLVSITGLVAVSTVFCAAQNVSPSHSGTVDYFEGDVSIDGAKLVSQIARFSEMKNQSTLKSGLGRAEILLTPGVLLRVSENSSVKMLDNSLMSTRVELLSGTAMVEALESGTTVKDPPVTIVYKNFEAQPVKYGIFEITSDPAQLRVFKGESRVIGNGATVNVKDGNRMDLATTMVTSKFDAKVADDLYLWSRDRSAYLSAGNLSSARTLASADYGSGFLAAGWNAAQWRGFSGGWYYNPYLNMYSFMPFAGTMTTPFGYEIFNPLTIGDVYAPGYYWSGAGGARTATTTGVPLSSAPAGSLLTRTSGMSRLPRLGTTATLRPISSSPLRGAEVSAPVTSFAGRNPGFNLGNQNPMSAPTFNSAPSASAMSAPSRSVSAPAPAFLSQPLTRR